jgi:hypothetical protein
VKGGRRKKEYVLGSFGAADAEEDVNAEVVKAGSRRRRAVSRMKRAVQGMCAGINWQGGGARRASVC